MRGLIYLALVAMATYFASAVKTDLQRKFLEMQEVKKGQDLEARELLNQKKIEQFNKARTNTAVRKREVGFRKKRQIRVDDCWQGGPVQPLNWNPGAWLVIFADLTIDCPGTVMRWEFYARQPGTFMAGIWRPLGHDRFRYLGSNTIEVQEEGYHVTHVTPGSRLVVEPGDVIGIHYPSSADANTGGVVPFDDNRYPLSEGVSSAMMSTFHTSNTRDEVLTPGETMVYGMVPSYSTRLPAIRAFVGIGASGGVLMVLGYEAMPRETLDLDSNAMYVTDPSQSTTVDGVVVGWNVYVERVGTIYLQVWRNVGPTQYTLIGETEFLPESTGAHYVALEGNQQIQVQAGDTLGLYFPADSVVPFDYYWPCSDVNAHLYFHPYEWPGSRVEGGDAIDFEIAPQDWGACRYYSFTAEILIQESGTGPIVPSPGPTGGPEPPSGDCGVPAFPPQMDQRIVGGIPAIPHSWPWMVSLQTAGGFHFCGGSLVDREWVVTAAHCMPGWSSSDQVVLGLHNKVSGAESAIVRHATAISHEAYDPWAYSTDVALLHLDSPVDFQEEISPVCLEEAGVEYVDGAYCYTTGWGDTSAGGSSPDVLNQVGVPLVDRETCNLYDWYDGMIDETMVCAGYEEGGKDSCQGDSGGPLVCQDSSGVWRLTGIVSWGYGCAGPRKPGVYSYVPSFREWIDANMESFSP